ncbi:MAG: lipopolysaccharide biosynthesis protein [Candidatus Eisenbacteria bacterium]
MHRTLGRNAFWNITVKTAYIALWVVLTPAVLGRLGREQFGFWSLMMLLGGSITFLDLGLTAAMTTYTAQLLAAGRRGAVARTLWRGLAVYALFGLMVMMVGMALTPLVRSGFHVGPAWWGEASRAYHFTLLGFAIASIVGVLQGALVGIHRMDLSSKIGLALAPLLLGLSLMALRTATPLVSLAIAQLIHTSCTLLVLAVSLGSLFRSRPGDVTDIADHGPGVREMIRYGLRIQLSVLGNFLHLQVDRALVGARIGLAWVTPVDLGLRVTNGISNMPQLFLGALLPAIADVDTRASGEGRGELYRRMMTPYVLVLVPIGAITIALSDVLMRLWLGGPHADAALALRILMTTSTVTLIGGVGAMMARAGGRPGLESRYSVGALVMHVAASLLGLRLLGWPGTLVGGLVASVIATVWFLGAIDRWLGLPRGSASLGPLARALPPALIAGSAAWLVQRWQPGSGRLAQLVPLTAAASVFTLGYVLLLRRVAPVETRELLQRIRALATGRGGGA